MIYQTTDSSYLLVCPSTKDIGDPAGWTGARPAYLFFARDHREVAVMTTRVDDYPNGFGWPRVDERFAAGEQLRYSPGQNRWTDEVSHGEDWA